MLLERFKELGNGTSEIALLAAGVVKDLIVLVLGLVPLIVDISIVLLHLKKVPGPSLSLTI